MVGEDPPRSRQYSVEVHHRDEDKVPGAQDTVNSLQLLVQVVVFGLKKTIRLSEIQGLYLCQTSPIHLPYPPTTKAFIYEYNAQPLAYGSP